MKENNELRAIARQQLQGVWRKMAFAVFIYFLIISPYFLFSVFNNVYVHSQGNRYPIIYGLTTALWIAIIIVTGPFTLGFANYYLKRIHDENIELINIFYGFKRFSQSFLLSLLIGIFTFLWSLLLIIPGIIKALSYSMAFYILSDNPNISPVEALRKSKIMMQGHKLQLFSLGFSFLGWILLCVLSLGIGFLWLYPYICLSSANFYENLKQNQVDNIVKSVE
jgi:uncharacterized membrane protein